VIDALKAAELKQANSRKPIEILIVDSNPADTRMTIDAFRSAGGKSGLHCVHDGQEALLYVRNAGQYADCPLPDMIFLDLSLPSVSGLEVLKAIKSTPELMHIPIVVASGSQDPEDVRAVYALNGNCFIRRPTELTQLVRFIETCYEFWNSVVTLSSKLAPAVASAAASCEGTRTL
jgi:CheY-like chemotaxis protein